MPGAARAAVSGFVREGNFVCSNLLLLYAFCSEVLIAIMNMVVQSYS